MVVSKGQRDRWHVDLQLAAVITLIEQGIPPEQIEVLQACTCCLPEDWFSFQREGKGCGRNWACIKPSNPKR